MVKEFMARVPPPVYIPPALPAPAPVQAPAPAPGPAPALPPPARAPRPSFFLGQPIAPLVVGTDIGIDILGGRPCACAVPTNFPGRPHRPYECPIRIFAAHNRCPGWTGAGSRIPACWNGDVLTPACQAEWRAFATCAFGRGPDANVFRANATACVGTRCSAMPVGFEPSRSSDRTALCAKQRAPLYATHALL